MALLEKIAMVRLKAVQADVLVLGFKITGLGGVMAAISSLITK
jgi:hypothetical protein